VREVLERLKGRKVRITCVFGNDSPTIFYNGRIVRVFDNSVLIVDKFGKEVILSFDSIKELKELEEDK